MNGSWRSVYRRAGYSARPAPLRRAPYEQALQAYFDRRKQAQRTLLILGTSGVAVFIVGCVALGRLSLRVFPPAPPLPAEVVRAPAAPAVEIAPDAAGLEALSDENIQLKLEVHRRMEAVERAYTLAADWSFRARHSDRATRPAPPPELLQVLGLEVADDRQVRGRAQP